MGARTLESVFAAVNTIYEAALDQERWGDAVSQVRDLFGGSRACIVRIGPDDSDSVCTLHDPEVNSAAGMQAIMSDPLAAAHLGMPVGAIWERSMVVDETAFRQRDLWRYWFRPRDMHNELVCKLASSGSAHWFLDINRGPRQGAFSATDIDLMGKIAPHMLRAGQITRCIAGTRTATILRNMPLGLLLVDGNRRLLSMNDTAEVVLARPGSPLVLKEGAIGASDPETARRLSLLVADACSLHDGVMPGPGGALRVLSRPDGPDQAGYVLSIAPYREAPFYGLATERYAAITVTEMAPRVGETFEAHIRSVFKLSVAEARLAADLASGLSVAQSASKREVTISSARTYLYRIFCKTGARQQSQLVAMLKAAHPPVTL